MRYFLTLSMFLLVTGIAFSQIDLPVYDYGNKATYNIGGIKITGAESRDRNAIKSIAALREGKEIEIPGDAIPKAIKSLYKLKLFEDVQIVQEKIEDNLIYLEIILKERPTLSRYSIIGEKKNKHSNLTDIIDNTLSKGSIVTEDLKALTIQLLEDYYVGEGFLDAGVSIREIKDELKDNAVRLVFNVDKKQRVKISNVIIKGNTKFSDTKLRRKMKSTKQVGTFLKKSKFVDKDFKDDKQNIIDFYNKHGYRDATIVSDSIYRRVDGNLQLFLTVDEGEQYFFRNIKWKGNSKYTEDQLSNVLGIQKGDVYDPELLERRLSFSMDGRDVSSLYLDDGYLFFNIDPVEVAVTDNSIDMEMQVYEGPQATISSINIAGNDRTHEHVIRRELRTKPGNKFSRSDIIRSQRSLMNLGYFNPESMDIQPKPNQQNGTVDIDYTVEERPSDQLELSAGYGGVASGLIGTLGVTFNNFSLANIKDKSSWSPLPQGDGQRLSIRAQSNSRFFKSYNLSFTEPWLGGKKPTSLTVGAVHSAYDQELSGRGKLGITRIFAGVGTQLKWPDDFFSANLTATFENISLDDYAFGQFRVQDDDGNNINITNGKFRNFHLNATISRSSVADPIYPRRGSRISLSIQATPPYSLFRDNTVTLSQEETDKIISDLIIEPGPGNPPTAAEIANAIEEAELSKKFQFLEYHKWRINGEWYFNMFDKFVLAANVKMGFLGRYTDELGISPFERFEVGGDGLSNQTAGITGKDIISLRGYEVRDLPINLEAGGGTIYDKFTLELRYPLSTNPNSAIYMHTFLQGGNVWTNFGDFNPFDLNRSTGFGVRIFLPMFGLLGFDYGWGFDRNPNTTGGGYGKFNIILGFEPE